MEELEEAIRSVVGEVLSIDPNTLSDTDGFSKGTWSSLNHMTILLALSERFGFDVTPEAVRDMTSLKAIAIYLRENTGS